MWWEQLKDWITWFFNLTLPIVGISLGVLCFLILKILSKTSFGKKLYNKMQKKVEDALISMNTFTKSMTDDFENYKNECDSKIKAIEEYYETMLAQKQAKEDAMEVLVLEVCENIHNDKVKVLVENYKKKMDGCKTIMTDRINEVKADYEKRILALEEKIYGKERIDNNTEEEKI